MIIFYLIGLGIFMLDVVAYLDLKDRDKLPIWAVIIGVLCSLLPIANFVAGIVLGVFLMSMEDNDLKGSNVVTKFLKLLNKKI